MANTIMTAKNSFAEGLIMDFAPDNTQATCLTSALNATLLTFNGNEMSLQNDMGNGRVETAFLPEGYVPVGTCEFGDIIYIVSYNPLINKSQIGCFPSPERNISSEEIGDLAQTLNWEDFQESNGEKPNGKLKASSVKKILYDSKSLNPGDKYIIYSSEVDNNSKTLSDYSNLSQTHNTFPKLVKIHVVAIEDSGKINYLDSSVKWYDNDYYISNKRIKTANGDGDIDEYRNLVSSNYSIFQSKVSGKLAILVELEKISTFNHSYSIKTEDNGNDRNYTVNLNVSWETLNKNINPSGVVITDSQWRYVTKDEYGKDVIKYNTVITEYNETNETNETKKVTESLTIKDYNPNPSSKSYYGFYLGRTYKPECKIEYKDFINTYQYNVIIKNYDDYTNIVLKEIQEIPESEVGNMSNISLGNTYYKNPKYINGEYKKINSDGVIDNQEPVIISDDVVNNYFHKEVTKELISVKIPYKTVIDGKTYYNDISNFVWDYKIAPVMPYGILEDLEMSGSIDFSKIGSGMIDLSEWRYYNDGNISTLKWGLEAYPENNKKITKVAFEFYDNQGVVGTYIIKDKTSFSGSFTEVLQLGAEGINPKLTPNDIDGDLITEHAGDGPYTFQGDISEFDDIIGTSYVVKDGFYYKNDAGVLYPNLVYLVKIYVYTAEIDSLGNIIGEQTRSNPFIRFYWTNGLLNNYYYNTIDYVGIQPELSYQLDVSFKSNDNFYAPRPESDPDKYIINNQSTAPNEENPSAEDVAEATLGGMIQRVETTGTGNNRENLYMSIVPCLDNSYNTFTFDYDKLSKVNYNIYLADQNIVYSNKELIFSDSYVGNITALNPTKLEEGKDDKLSDYFSIGFTPNTDKKEGSIVYQTVDGKEESGNYTYIETSAKDAMSFKKSLGVPLILEGQMVSKIAGTVYDKIDIEAIVYKPAIKSTEDYAKYNITLGSVPYFENCLTIGVGGDKHPKCHFGTATSDGNYGDYWLQPESARTIYDGEQIKNMNIGNLYKEANIDVGPYATLAFFCFDGEVNKWGKPNDISEDERDGMIDLRSTGGKGYSTSSWSNNWQPNSGNTIGNIRYPMKNGENYPDGGCAAWSNGNNDPYRSLSAFVAKTSGGKYILFNNFFSSDTSKTNVSQTFYKSQYNKTTFTFAQMLISLLSKLYYRSEETTTKSINAVSNIVTWSDYTVTWKKNLVIEVKYDEGRNLLVMQGLDYMKYIENWINDTSIPNKENINIKLDMEKVHTTQFQYNLKYNIDYLQKLYNSQDIKYYIDEDITKTFEGRSVGQVPFQGTFGILNHNTNTFSNIGSVTTVPALDSYLKNTSNLISISDKILNNLTIKDDIVMIKDTVTPGYNAAIHMQSGNSGDSKGKCFIKLDTSMCFFNDSVFKLK